MKELKILSPTAILGYGFPEESFQKGLKEKPDFVAVDAGSTDPGPYYLGAGISFTDRNAVKRDLTIIMNACMRQKIPFVVGTAGGSGAKPHLEWALEIVKEIAKEEQLKFKLAVIPADIKKDVVLKKFEENKITKITNTPPLTKQDIENSRYIVAQMGMEPMIEAFKQGADMILCGRAYDPACFACFPVMKGYDQALALHLGKILECASIAALPGSGSDCMMGYLGDDYFKIKPLNPIRKCTVTSVSAHTLYEKSDPYLLPGPGGVLDLTETVFEQADEQTVKVTGSKHKETPLALKLEASLKIGFRTVSIAGTRDPIMIESIDAVIDGVKKRTQDNFKKSIDQYALNFRVYGKEAVNLFKIKNSSVPEEIGIVIEAVAKTQSEANTICSFARSTMLHYGYDGRISTAGNLAFPFSPSDFEAGEVYQFSLYHLMELDQKDQFSIQMIEF